MADSPSISPLSDQAGRNSFPQRWMVWALVALATLGAIGAISGTEATNVFGSFIFAIFLLPVLLPAWMFGLLITRPFARRGCFEGSPWPAGFQSLVALALGLGFFSLGTLLLGSLGLIAPGGALWPAALLPIIATAAGLLPTRDFLRSPGPSRLRAKAHRGEWLYLLAAIPAAMLLIAATFPPGTLWASEAYGYDVMDYHLQLPREYALNNSTAPLAHNVYSYLPANVEMLYLQLMQIAKAAMGGSPDNAYVWGTFPSQFLHALLALLTAAAIALAPLGGEDRERPWLHATGRAIAAVFFLGTPWVIVTGSLAYNEMGMLFFGTLALGLAAGGIGGTPADGNESAGSTAAPPRPYLARGLLIGILLGLAVGCKMTAGVFFAIPVAAMLAWRGMTKGGYWKTLASATLMAAVVYAPWAIRAGIASGGNPLFPIATSILGRGTWTEEQAQQFSRGHQALQDEKSLPARAGALAQRSLMDAQWSVQPMALTTLLDQPRQPQTGWARLNLLILIVPLAIGGALILKQGRLESGLLVAALAIQLLAWMFTTHLQARFLLPIAVPLALLAGRATQGLHMSAEGAILGMLRIATGVLVGIHALCAMFLLLPEVGLFGGAVTGGGRRPPAAGELFERIINVAQSVENFGRDPALMQPVPPAHTLLIGDAAAWRFEGPITYFTTFDTIPFSPALKAQDHRAAVQWMRDRGVRYVLVNWNEVERLRRTYGFDDAITQENLAALTTAGLEDTKVDFGNGIAVFRVRPTPAAHGE